MNRRTLLRGMTCVALWVAATTTHAVTYIVLPLIGDQFTIVGARSSVGSHLDRNDYQVQPLADPVLDVAASRFVTVAIARTQPFAELVTLRANDAEIYRLREKLTDADPAALSTVMSLIEDKLRNLESPRLVLISPYRAEVQLKVMDGTIGTGKVAGLGFYIDRRTLTQRDDTMESAIGFLGVFANFRITVIDVASKKTLAQDAVATGTVLSAARSKDTHPWGALSGRDKVQLLEDLMHQEADRMLPALLQQAGP